MDPSERIVNSDIRRYNDIFRMLNLALDNASDGGIFNEELSSISNGDSVRPVIYYIQRRHQS